jgi:16S rRNA (guanine1207-N2)-methyltransferase
MATGVLPEVMDPADRLLLDEAAGLLDNAAVVVIDGIGIAQELEARVAGLRIVLDSAAAADYFSAPLPAEEALAGADVVLLRLPKSLERLDDIARLVARNAKPTVTLIASGRLKYMTLGMNEVLSQSFGDVRASLARQKSRVLFASSPLIVEAPLARRHYHHEFDLWAVAWGGVFAGTSIDIGTRAMLETFDSLPEFATAIDLGCGTGMLAAELKRRRPNALVIGSDDSDAAARSARETMAANGLDVEIRHEDTLNSIPDASVDLIVLNPPFHSGGPVSTDIAQAMFVVAARKLKPGGQLRTVWNTHLGYKRPLANLVGPTNEIFRNAKFTVTVSTTPSAKLSRIDSGTN